MRQKSDELQQKRRQSGSAAGSDQPGQLATTVQEFMQRAEQSNRQAVTLGTQAEQINSQAEQMAPATPKLLEPLAGFRE